MVFRTDESNGAIRIKHPDSAGSDKRINQVSGFSVAGIDIAFALMPGEVGIRVHVRVVYG